MVYRGGYLNVCYKVLALGIIEHCCGVFTCVNEMKIKSPSDYQEVQSL